MAYKVEELELFKLRITGEKGDECDLQQGPLPEHFYSPQCPFTWKESLTHDKMEKLISIYEGLLVGEPKEWKGFCKNLYSAYFNVQLGKMIKALEHIKLCEELLCNKSKEDFYKDIFNGMDHVLKASVAHTHFLKGDSEKAEEVMATVIPEKDLSEPCRGALIAIHATGSHDYELKSKEKTLTMIESVIKLDPDENGLRRGIWYYMAGKLHGQIRRINYRTQIPSKEELQLLERATKYNPFPVYLATLAESYREAANNIYFSRDLHVDKGIIDKFNKEGKRLLKAAIEMDDSNPSTLRRCGNGLMRLPQRYKDIPLARQCLEKSLKLDPNNAPSYQVLGTLEEKHSHNLAAAHKYYQMSADNGNLLAGLSAMRVCFKIDSSYNPLKDCDEYFEKAVNERNVVKAAFLVAKGEYYLFIANDLISAAKEWEKAIGLAPETDSVMKHWRIFYGKYGESSDDRTGRKVLNVYECLKNEITRATPTSTNDRVFLNRIFKMCEMKAKII